MPEEGELFLLICWRSGFHRDCLKGIKSGADILKASYIVGNFKKVVIIQTGIEAFVQLVIGHRMKHFIIDPSSILRE